jgi:serine/threonine protein kinase
MCALCKDLISQNRLKLEYQIASQLNHPNIPKYLDIIETTHDLCLFIEYCGDTTLEAYIKEKGCLKDEEARKYFAQLLDTVRYCHERNVYHGDIKLSNVLMRNGHLKLIDFDASKATNSLRTTFCGEEF